MTTSPRPFSEEPILMLRVVLIPIMLVLQLCGCFGPLMFVGDRSLNTYILSSWLLHHQLGGTSWLAGFYLLFFFFLFWCSCDAALQPCRVLRLEGAQISFTISVYAWWFECLFCWSLLCKSLIKDDFASCQPKNTRKACVVVGLLPYSESNASDEGAAARNPP